ncbi:MAG TPA: murein biosynthesis integral membrane protein MurJ [Nocardioides sp.]
MSESSRLMNASAVMAAGTAVSRLSGYVRSVLLIAALGGLLHADLFTIANTLPNMVYILLAGGVFNAVLVPQLVRAQAGEDGGAAYTNRVITLAALFLGGVTIVLVAVAPWLLRLYLDSAYLDPDRAAHLASIVDLTRWCLPQVFFYGMFVLVGQVLNARGTFGPMMWAPIANNLIAVAMLVTYLVVHGTADGDELVAAYSTDQEVLLGLGSTLGIVAQFLILLPYLRRAGFHFRPRFDFRDAGLGHTLRLGTWTVLFVVVNQLAYLVVVKLASGGTAHGGEGTGYTVYQNTFLIMMVPHAIVTVSLATAILPRLSELASEDRLRDLGLTLARTLRTSLAIVLPVAALVPLLARDVAAVLFGWGAGAGTVHLFAPSLALFAPGLVLFTVHYFMLRGFYALEQTRLVFFIQCAIAATNIVAAVLLVAAASREGTSPALVAAYGTAYAVGSAISYAVLRRRLGGLDTPRLVRFLARALLACAGAALVTWLVTTGLGVLGEEPPPLVSGLRGGLAGLAGLATYLLLARAMRVREVTEVVNTVLGRLRRG